MEDLMFDVEKVREEFPILQEQVNGRPLVYLDSAASTQKPKAVIDAISDYYRRYNSNVHRGVHTLSQLATDAFEETRTLLQKHLNARHLHEIIFTKGTTDGINLVANGMRSMLKAGDEVVVSHMEHHSNIVPWQLACEITGASLKVIPMTSEGELDMQAYRELLSDKTRLVAVNHVSNALGTVNPIEQIIEEAHQYGAWVLIDGAQSAPHFSVDVQALDCEFYAFSGHKVYGPTGVGALYGKEPCLNLLPPYQGGGEMIKEVKFSGTTYAELPHKFEAGTPNIAGVIGLGAAIKWMRELGMENIAAHEDELMQYALKGLSSIEGIQFIGTASKRAGAISFNIDGVHPFDVGTIIDKLGIAVRTGHHCAQPIMDYYQIPGTVRASLAVHTTKSEIDSLVAAVERAVMMLR